MKGCEPICFFLSRLAARRLEKVGQDERTSVRLGAGKHRTGWPSREPI